MKKTFLYLFFVIVLINSVFAVWFIDDTGINPTQFQANAGFSGNHIKILNADANKINIIKKSLVTANICAVFEVGSFTYLTQNFSFIGDNCSISYNFINNTEYILGVFKEGGFNQYYDTAIMPFNTSNIEWINLAFNNIPDNWTFYNNYIGDFTKLEINLTIPEIPPANITPNATQTNQTDVAQAINNLSTSLNKSIIILIAFILFLTSLLIIAKAKDVVMTMVNIVIDISLVFLFNSVGLVIFVYLSIILIVLNMVILLANL